MRRAQRGFTLLELLVVVAILAILLAMLLPGLAAAREQGKRARCLANLRQVAVGWHSYLTDNGGCFYPNTCNARLYYGGREHGYSAERSGGCVLEKRPLNPYVGYDPQVPKTAEVYRCPSDTGATGLTHQPGSQGVTTYDFWGNSYPANFKLLTQDPLWRAPVAPEPPWVGPPPPVRLHHIEFPEAQVVLASDQQLYWTTQGTRMYTAFWHERTGTAMNVAFVDGHAAFTWLQWRKGYRSNYSIYFRIPNDAEAWERELTEEDD